MKILILLFVTISFCNQSFASAKSENAEWFKCENDEDCVDINYACAGQTVNKKYQKEANEYYRGQNAVRDCAISPHANEKLPPFKVFCKEHKCTKQGKNPKVGFS